VRTYRPLPLAAQTLSAHASELFKTTRRSFAHTAQMPEQLEAAAAFVTTHARILDRHRLRVLLGDDNAPQALAALEAYSNPDGGYGWGLEPDLRCSESQPGAALHAFELWADVGSPGGARAERLCNWLASQTLPDGGLPFALPIADPTGCSPWWVAADPSTSSLQITTAVVANAHRVATHNPVVAAHPWLREATRFCLAAIGGLRSAPPAYVLSFSLRLLDVIADTTPAAADLVTKLVDYLPTDGVLAVEGGLDDEAIRPLDYAPEPKTAVRNLLPASSVAADLARLTDLQQADGGWPIDWAVASPAAALDWRGYVTVRTLGVLRRNGQLGR